MIIIGLKTNSTYNKLHTNDRNAYWKANTKLNIIAMTKNIKKTIKIQQAQVFIISIIMLIVFNRLIKAL